VISAAFCIPGDLTLPTGGYRYDREVLSRFTNHGIKSLHVELPAGFPNPDKDDLAETKRLLSLQDRRTVLLIDGLALGAMPPALLANIPNITIALVHHPLGLEAGLDPERASYLMANEKAVLAGVAHVVVTSETTARILMQDFDVPERRITIAEPGTHRASRATGTGQPVQILAVGAVSARKAYDSLVAALAPLSASDWHLTIVGSLERSPDAVRELQEIISANDLTDRITLAGAVNDITLEAHFARSDLFAMSSLFEGYGMALAEALAHGVPIVTSSGGAAAETVPDAAAIKVPPGDIMLLSEALGRTIVDATLRRRMADASWAAGALLPTWDDTTHTIAETIKATAG
jgi:glycosyltransferase involved in cell wall biosynthesis